MKTLFLTIIVFQMRYSGVINPAKLVRILECNPRAIPGWERISKMKEKKAEYEVEITNNAETLLIEYEVHLKIV